MLVGDEVVEVVADLKRATTYSVTAATADAVLERVADAVCKIIEQIERANENAYYTSPYAHSAHE
jgi:hypothetical protein